MTLVQNKLLKLGQINFINCLPLNHQSSDLFQDWELKPYQGSPSQLNQMLRSGELDLAPISSYEYLLNQDQYELIDGLSISSKTQADSVLVFSKCKLENATTIHITNKSASSVNLLKILLVKKYGHKLEELEFISFKEPSEEMATKLLIGDEALLNNDGNAIDLGQEWYGLTGLPMVFGLWVMNKNSELIESKAEITKLLVEKKSHSLNENYPDLIIEAYRATGLNKTRLKEYFENLDYDFTEKHITSLNLYRAYLKELELI